jgi:hypothetical protein
MVFVWIRNSSIQGKKTYIIHEKKKGKKDYIYIFEEVFSSPGPKIHVNYCHHFMYSLGSVSSLVSEKKSFEISANQSILLALAAIFNIRLERKTVTW